MTTKTKTTETPAAAAPVAIRTLAPVPVFTFQDLERMAGAVAASKMFGLTTKESALALMLVAQAEGRHPAIAARDYHIIEGRPSLKADAMLARFMEAGGRVQWHEITDQKCSATFSNPDGGHFKVEWTIDMAKAAGLVRNNRDGSPGMWMKYPRQMLRSRTVAEGVRTIMPGVIVGTYTPEELRDGDVPEREVDASVIEGEVIQPKTPDAPAAEPANPKWLTDSQIADHCAAIEAAGDIGELKKAHALAYEAAWNAEDFTALKTFGKAKDAARAKLDADITGGAR